MTAPCREEKEGPSHRDYINFLFALLLKMADTLLLLLPRKPALLLVRAPLLLVRNKSLKVYLSTQFVVVVF